MLIKFHNSESHQCRLCSLSISPCGLSHWQRNSHNWLLAVYAMKESDRRVLACLCCTVKQVDCVPMSSLSFIKIYKTSRTVKPSIADASIRCSASEIKDYVQSFIGKVYVISSTFYWKYCYSLLLTLAVRRKTISKTKVKSRRFYQNAFFCQKLQNKIVSKKTEKASAGKASHKHFNFTSTNTLFGRNTRKCRHFMPKIKEIKKRSSNKKYSIVSTMKFFRFNFYAGLRYGCIQCK